LPFAQLYTAVLVSRRGPLLSIRLKADKVAFVRGVAGALHALSRNCIGPALITLGDSFSQLRGPPSIQLDTGTGPLVQR
jgi:hypothetical protein